jgi:hypothetical protein
MTSRVVALAVALVRAWTRVYTWRLPQHVRDFRRWEIESDLFESQRDAGPSSRLALQVTIRLLLGVPDDLRWRVSYTRAGGTLGFVIAALATTAFLIAAFVWIDLMSARRLPVPPPVPVSERQWFPVPPSTNELSKR